MTKRTASKGLRILASWLLLGAILACGGGDDPDEPDDPNTFSIAPGFTPDPMTQTGEAGGPFDASTRNSACIGWIGAVSNHTLNLTQAFTNLRVIVSSATDTTLVIQLESGEYRCNDDGDGLNPVVQGAFPAGRHRVFVGTYGQNSGGPYTIGVTENAAVTANQIGGGTGRSQPRAAAAAAPDQSEQSAHGRDEHGPRSPPASRPTRTPPARSREALSKRVRSTEPAGAGFRRFRNTR